MMTARQTRTFHLIAFGLVLILILPLGGCAYSIDGNTSESTGETEASDVAIANSETTESRRSVSVENEAVETETAVGVLRRETGNQQGLSAVTESTGEAETERGGEVARGRGGDKDVTPEEPRASADASPQVSPSGNNWPRFRGPDGSGVSVETGLPPEWSETKNIVWKTELPGPGSSSPITFDDHVYVTCYSGYGLSQDSPGDKSKLVRHLVCVSRQTGRILWTTEEKSIGREESFTGFHALHGYATNTPAADENGVYILFGTSGALGYSHSGKKLWQTSLGAGVNSWGSSASVVLHEGKSVFHADIEGGALVALDTKTGREVWRVGTGGPDSWSTPLVINTGERDELIYHHSQGDPTATLAAVNPIDGSPFWTCRVLKNYLCPSPVYHKGTIYTIAFQRSAAVRPGGRGDVTGTHVVWTGSKGTEICTPILHAGNMYWAHQESGLAYCLDATTGEVVYEERIQPRPGKIYASGVLADGRIYYVSRENGTYIISASPKFELLSHNVIESDRSIFNATPAISGGQLLVRSDRFLYCIGKIRN